MNIIIVFNCSYNFVQSKYIFFRLKLRWIPIFLRLEKRMIFQKAIVLAGMSEAILNILKSAPQILFYYFQMVFLRSSEHTHARGNY